MTDATDEAAAGEQPVEPAKKKKQKKPGFTFTKDGCRTEIRVGVLLLLAGVFFWLFLGPVACTRICIVGLAAILIGVPLQALDGKRYGRPGYPIQLGIILTIGGLLMIPDLCYRETVDGPLQVQIFGPLLVLAGVWMLAWWPVSKIKAQGQGVRA